MHRFLLLLFLLFNLTSCRHSKPGITPGSKHRIALLPFKGIESAIVADLKKNLEIRLKAEILILPEVVLPANSFYPKRQRYIADTLLEYLEAHKQNEFLKIIGVAAHDISTQKEAQTNWGIMGLAFCPGDACVISSFRVKKTIQSRHHYNKRMLVLALHELGHTYSLPHCKNNPCLMRDAEGKMNLDNGEEYCGDCKKVLGESGVLK